MTTITALNQTMSRRSFLGSTVAGAIAGSCMSGNDAFGQVVAAKPEVLNPRMRVPLSFIIDDSTCLVNMGHYCMPQFATAHPDREEYRRPWKTWPREIPDSFVREFGEWCAEHDVRGKYSIVPYPACVGWVDREMPGWSKRELEDSLKLVRELMVPRWDIHPEMITHTRIIDLKTGRPVEEISPATMENSWPREKKSVDEIAAYLAYALRILKNCDLPCEGITTPGGFGNMVKPELSLAVHDAVRDVYGTDLPHYFKYVETGNESTRPRLEHVRGLDSDDPKVTVNVPAGTGDWFGGWDGDREPEPDRYATADASSGRMVELIEQGQPAVMLCHWPGMYSHGQKTGFHAFQRVVTSLKQRFGNNTLWMKVSDIGRYYTAAELCRFEASDDAVTINTPFGTRDFTVRLPGVKCQSILVRHVDGTTASLEPVRSAVELRSGHVLLDEGGAVVCFDLQKGATTLAAVKDQSNK